MPELKQSEEGENLPVVETAEGDLLTTKDAVLDDQLKAGREFMNRYHETFRALAK